MIASDQIDRHLQRRKQLCQTLVFLHSAVICEIAGRDDCVWQARQRKDFVYATLQHASGVDSAIGKSALRNDVRITNLAEQHYAERSGCWESPQCNEKTLERQGA